MAYITPAPPTPPQDARAVVSQAVTTTLARSDVPMEQKDVAAASAKTTSAVMEAIDASGKAVVPVQSPLTSKINWTALIMLLLGVLTYFGVPIPDDQKLNITTALLVIGPVLIAVFKTFFTRSISSGSK